jgi:hypothetical protein
LEENFLNEVFGNLLQGIRKDVWHLMEFYKVKKTHALFGPFMSYIRRAMFIESSEDVKNLKSEVTAKIRERNPNWTEEQVMSKVDSIPSSYYSGKVRRIIPDVWFTF